MKNAYIITNNELKTILQAHLSGEGYNTAGMTLRFTATNAIVAGITPVEHFDDQEDPSSFDDEVEAQVEAALINKVRAHITLSPKSVNVLAQLLDEPPSKIGTMLSEIGAEAVAPCREYGKTVSLWMLPGTSQHAAFVAGESARIEECVSQLADLIQSKLPRFYEEGISRPEAVERACLELSDALIPTQSVYREELRRDARAVFYAMKESGLLQHDELNHTWRCAVTKAERAQMEALKNGVRELLPQGSAATQGLTLKSLYEKLPGLFPMELLRCAIGEMPEVQEEHGLLYLSSNA